ncbi:leucyl/phenylalanyl-tRNA--protein transferase [Tessaracoccus sp. OH4464_COT-324]|uniref:leucyl/phenylalanyl-tRNA--protein transferase n=1 Tax=Tessaracoccus sp. OH4464_COT-324 TaxID=2491059 RepID=UPI000F640632|nr:leucyl/phenylalanyl-tRNA--protein transferase [Tessaracoccus sp. OH4464_COT-324]RRD46200.1 leucyl/phenylalanyl-tRNA--protein transferase [Tessaracoccus sp. OH4464_COT-324]
MRSTIFGDPATWPEGDLIGVSEEFDAALTVEAYLAGVFPMPVDKLMGWWSPGLRGILPLDGLKVSRSLRKSARRYTTTLNVAFDEVLTRCADPNRPLGWIDERIAGVYRQLHRLGVAHSVETWDADGHLVGGLYGVHLKGLFAGESMFHTPEGRDASKVALLRLVEVLRENGASLLDVQWITPHLASLGAVEVTRDEYLALLDEALGGE